MNQKIDGHSGENAPIKLVPYDNLWPEKFAAEYAAIKTRLAKQFRNDREAYT